MRKNKIKDKKHRNKQRKPTHKLNKNLIKRQGGTWPSLPFSFPFIFFFFLILPWISRVSFMDPGTVSIFVISWAFVDFLLDPDHIKSLNGGKKNPTFIYSFPFSPLFWSFNCFFFLLKYLDWFDGFVKFESFDCVDQVLFWVYFVSPCSN